MHLDASLYIRQDSDEEEVSPEHDANAIEFDLYRTLIV